MLSTSSITSLNLTNSIAVNNSYLLTKQESITTVVQHSKFNNQINKNGTVEISVQTKTPAEVFGEKVLRPLINRTVSIVRGGYNIVSGGFHLIDKVFSAAVNILPGAKANSLCQDKPSEVGTEDSDKRIKKIAISCIEQRLVKINADAVRIQKKISDLDGQLARIKERMKTLMLELQRNSFFCPIPNVGLKAWTNNWESSMNDFYKILNDQRTELCKEKDINLHEKEKLLNVLVMRD